MAGLGSPLAFPLGAPGDDEGAPPGGYPCVPITLLSPTGDDFEPMETGASGSTPATIRSTLTDFTGMTPVLDVAIAFDGSWSVLIDDLPVGGGEASVQLSFDGVVVATVQITSSSFDHYSASFPGIANPAPGGESLVVATLVPVAHGDASNASVNNMVVTITCAGGGGGGGGDSLITPAPILAANTGELDTGVDIACIIDVGTSLSLARGPRNVGNALARRLVTPRGGLFYDPNYGLDIRSYLNAGFTPQALAQVQSDVASEVSKDPRVENPTVTVASNLATASMQITITCDLAEGPYEFVFGVSNLTVELLKQQALA